MSGESTAYRPRRSVLYMPSSNERALEKAKTRARMHVLQRNPVTTAGGS
jgi:hypothetical protein